MAVTKFEKPMGTEVQSLSEQIVIVNSKMVSTIKSNAQPWPSDTLVFSNIPNSMEFLYRFTMFDTGTGFMTAYIWINNGTVNVQRTFKSEQQDYNVAGSYSSNTLTLTINVSGYYRYTMERIYVGNPNGNS